MDAVKYFELLAWALEQIGKLTANKVDDMAPEIVRAVYAIYKTLMGASTGKVTADKARKDIDKLVAAVQANDDAADAALKKKFKK